MCRSSAPYSFSRILLWLFDALNRSPYTTQQGVARVQPVQFSHQHHVGAMGIDCRYCHTTVERAAFAEHPADQDLHELPHADLGAVAGARAGPGELADRRARSRGSRSTTCPDYVYFNHSIHVAKGVGCETCHGRVDRMPLVSQHPTLQMSWCLDCHREPEKNLRPRDEIFTMGYVPAGNQEEIGKKLAARIQDPAADRVDGLHDVPPMRSCEWWRR